MGHTHDHDHSHGGKTTVILFFVGLAAFIIGLFLNEGGFQSILYIATFALAGYHIIIEGFTDTYQQTIRRKKFHPNVHILMTLAAIGAIIIGQYMEAALLILIFAGAHYLEDYAQGKSKKEITSLLNLNPTNARKLCQMARLKLLT